MEQGWDGQHSFFLDSKRREGHAAEARHLAQSNVPHYLFVFPLARLHRETALVHLMHIPSRLHITQYILLQLWDRLQGVRHVLVLLYVTDYLGGLSPLGEVYQRRLLYDRWDPVLDEREVGEIHACTCKV
jgi:hypothetical protein